MLTLGFVGTLEDPATGSAACGLGALLALKHGQRRVKYEMTQAVEMGRKSDIGVRVELAKELNAVSTIELSGSSVQIMDCLSRVHLSVHIELVRQGWCRSGVRTGV